MRRRLHSLAPSLFSSSPLDGDTRRGRGGHGGRRRGLVRERPGAVQLLLLLLLLPEVQPRRWRHLIFVNAVVSFASADLEVIVVVDDVVILEEDCARAERGRRWGDAAYTLRGF